MTDADEIKQRLAEQEKQNRLPPIDPVRMFLRTLDQYDELVKEFHDVELKFAEHERAVAQRFRDQNDTIAGLEKRMDSQVSFTGHKNSAAIDTLNTKMEKLDTQLFDKDTGLITQFVAARRAAYSLLAINVFAVVVWLIQRIWFR